MSVGGYTFLFDVDDRERQNVFHDPTARRGRRVRRWFRAGLAVLVVWAALFFSGTVPLRHIGEELAFWWHSQVSWAAARAAAEADTAAAASGPTPQRIGASRASRASLRPTLAEQYRLGAAQQCTPQPAPALAALAGGTTPRRVFGHVATDRANAPLSLPRACGTVDVLMPDWIMLTLEGGRLTTEIAPPDMRDEIDSLRAITPTVSGADPALMPVVRLAADAPDRAAALLTDPELSAQALHSLRRAARAVGAGGLCLDFDQITGPGFTALAPFFEAFRDSFRAEGLKSCVVLPGDGPSWRDTRMTEGFDRVVVKLYQRAWLGAVPGPLADERWFAETAEALRDTLGPERLVVALGNFATIWTSGQPLPKPVSYAEAIEAAAAAGAAPRFSATTGNALAAWTDAEGQRHRAWLLDAVSAHNQLRILDDLGLSNVAIWSLGTEDPSLWPLLAADIRSPAEVESALAEVRLETHVSYRGEGAFLRVTAAPETGRRALRLAPESGRITEAAFTQLPKAYSLERYGRPAGPKLVLTFDDGPDPAYTGDILDILRDTGTPGAFFVVGSRVMQAPGLVERMVAEGHEIGAHSFSHPRMDKITRTRAEFEHAMTRKVIASTSGHETRLYREPFQRSGGPIEEARVASIASVQAEGGIIAGMEIVPKDWLGMTAEEIVDYVITEVEAGRGNVVLFHDGGGNRAETVKALPLLIEALHARGYSFTTLADLLGTTRAALMPVAEAPLTGFDKVSFTLLSGTFDGVVLLFWVVLALGLARSLTILVLVLRHEKVVPVQPKTSPKVAFVVPAYNEEASVARCVQTLLKSRYPNFEIIVVDDGSTDDTFEAVQRVSHDRRVKVFAQLNHGKWGALNSALRNTDAEIVVCIDADTQVRADALDHLVKHFANPHVGAVAGKVVVGNRVNLLTRLQALEYITAQNFERLAHDRLGSIMVVPGALGAWRVTALKDAGLYSPDTVTEDADMTVSVSRAGYRVNYEERAVAYTEAPESVKMLMSQRLRWSFGMFQTAWKHRAALFERSPVGRVAIPDLVIFGYLYALMAPVADALLVMLLWSHLFGAPAAAASMGLAEAVPTAFAYLALPLFELFVAGYALKADKDESLWMLLLFPFQRFFYRQLLYLSVLRALLRALYGTFTGWGIKKRMARDMLALREG